jgi:hypothetical protein
VTGSVALLLLAAATAFVGRAGWDNAQTWAAEAWEDPVECERRRKSLRRGAVACCVAAGVLTVSGLTSFIGALV